MAGGGGGDAASSLQRQMGVWWDLNTCPVPAGFEPRRVRGCIESALKKEMGHVSKVHMYAMGNLEYISSALLEEISSSGIVLVHAPCGGKSFRSLLGQWSHIYCPPPATLMLIDIQGFFHVTLDDNMTTCDEMIVNNNKDEPLCICDICYDTFGICGEFITHLKSEEHMEELDRIVPREYSGEPNFFCHVCNYPGYDDCNMLLHYQSEEHIRKVTTILPSCLFGTTLYQSNLIPIWYAFGWLKKMLKKRIARARREIYKWIS